VKDAATVPSDYALHQNYPNPFNPSTTIKYSLAHQSNVKLPLYNSIGQVVKVLINSPQSAGNHEINFSASGLSSGVYFYTLYAGSPDGNQSFHSTKKMVLLK
jgi:Secretion system C-terminal sorting domain